MSYQSLRYVYAQASTYARAMSMLEDMYAWGEVSDADRPLIEARRRGGKRWFVITLVEVFDIDTSATARYAYA